MKTKREVDGERDLKRADRERVEMVEVRVLPKGDGQISNGEHDPEGGDLVYERGDVFTVAKPIAEALEERGFAEIQQGEQRRGPGRPPKSETEA